MDEARAIVPRDSRTPYIGRATCIKFDDTVPPSSPSDPMDTSESVMDSDDDGTPPSTQPRRDDWDSDSADSLNVEPPSREWSMEQYICFVYRQTLVSRVCH